MTRELPQFLRDLISSPPPAGEGVHAWLFRVSRQLHAHLPAVDIVRLMAQQVQRCGRQVSLKEITDAVQNSIQCAWQPTGRGATVVAKPAAKWPEVNKERREAIIASGYGLADLWESSPVRMEDNEPHTEEIIDQLFPGNPLLCCGESNHKFNTLPREQWRGKLPRLALIVPSPMVAATGLTKDGRESKHTLSNTGPRRFVVCEFDGGTLDEQAALLLHLATKGPLVMALHSGGKSLHGWFRAYGTPEDTLRNFFAYAVSIGADPATWTRSQFVRMPDGQRENGNRQTVYFINFALMEVSR